MISFFGRGTESRKGFTLVELMIVIAIIGLLAVALLPKLIGTQSNARDVKRKKDLQDIAAALEQVYDERGQYVRADYYGTTLDRWLVTYTSIGNHTKISNNLWKSAPFLEEKFDSKRLPVDPIFDTKPNVLAGHTKSYFYYPFAERTGNDVGRVLWFTLSAKIENYRNANRYSIPWGYAGYSETFYLKGKMNIDFGLSWRHDSLVWSNNVLSSVWYAEITNQAREELKSFKDSLKQLDTPFPKDANGNDLYGDVTFYEIPAMTLFSIVKDHIVEP